MTPNLVHRHLGISPHFASIFLSPTNWDPNSKNMDRILIYTYVKCTFCLLKGLYLPKVRDLPRLCTHLLNVPIYFLPTYVTYLPIQAPNLFTNIFAYLSYLPSHLPTYLGYKPSYLSHYPTYLPTCLLRLPMSLLLKAPTYLYIYPPTYFIFISNQLKL